MIGAIFQWLIRYNKGDIFEVLEFIHDCVRCTQKLEIEYGGSITVNTHESTCTQDSCKFIKATPYFGVLEIQLIYSR